MDLAEDLAAAVDAVARWHTRCAFLMSDLDRFKSVNDTLGHLVGDQLLAQVAERIRRVCTSNEVCGRLGGDEFAVVIRDVPELIYIDRLAVAIIDAVSRPYVGDNHTLFIGASIGSATGPQDGADAEMLMRAADLAMYRAKEAGRGKHLRYASSMHADAEERRQLEIALRDALAKDELHLMFQPIVNTRSADVCGFEALVRWTHPELGAVSPAKFIPVAEDARLIAPIGNWVLRTACREAANWPVDVRISVNVSPEQLYEPDFLDMVVQSLAHSGLSANRLELEVTESVFLREGTGVSELLDQLMKLGVRLSLDDFGTGYSSLGYLSRTRFSTIKIDRSFVTGAARNQRESLAIVRAVVAMAQSLDMETTAEGVETEGEYDLIRALGCTKIQGYYFGRPMPATDARALFGDRSSQVACKALSPESAERQPSGPHLLDETGIADVRPVRMRFQRLRMQFAAPVDHGEDRQDRGMLAAAPDQRLDQIVERFAGERGGNDRHDEDVGGVQHLLGGFGEAGRAIQDDTLVALLQAFQQTGEALLLAQLEQ